MNLKHFTAAIAVIAAAAFSTPATAGAYNGPKRCADRVDANSADYYRIAFVAGKPACVVVKGDGDTDLDLQVFDENGNLVASDTDATDACLVSWTPKWTGNFTVKVINHGCVYSRYVLATN